MIHEEKCYCGTCDNCGELYRNEHHGFTMFSNEGECREYMNNDDWYTTDSDPDHKGKHYCPDCFVYDEEIDDKIHVDVSRKKELTITL